MTYDLLIGDYAYSSWSLRGWLLFERFGISRRVERVAFAEGSVTEQAPGWAPIRLVPAMRTPDGTVVGDSLAMAEELASRHPEAGLWPEDPKARAMARYLAAEMHSGFGALRGDCPMNMRLAYTGVAPSAEVEADLRRLEYLWDYARELCRPEGPWLCGAYSVADAFYAPVAARIAGYGLAVSESAQAYVEAHLNDGAFRRWRAMGLAHGATLERYAKPYATVDWPGPARLAAKAVTAGPSVNEACPYSGDPVTDFLDLDGVIYGFCNPFCRDKTVADPEAWPAFMALARG
ncbi:glutathione S-transferase [Roseovarius faecimaris]|uniref:Glutathione S-transferase n=1 Tax=Roseovarius faecimaris TaxID=2494550 RepID=A0A6I6IXH3_9RHOB|nr:glutathione S-transferase [Roseovarius faecimaris]QGX97338.1 glutathione S-transferase [Roseovarius faecimaris]